MEKTTTSTPTSAAEEAEEAEEAVVAGEPAQEDAPQSEETATDMPIMWLATEVAAACGMHPFRSEQEALASCLTRFAGPSVRAWAAKNEFVAQAGGSPKPVVEDADVKNVHDVNSLTAAVKGMVSHEVTKKEMNDKEQKQREHAVRHAMHQRLGHTHEAETLRVFNVSREAEKRGKWFRSRNLRHDIKFGGRMDAITPKGRPIEVKTRMYRLPKNGPPMYDIVQVIVYMVLTESDCGVLIERTLDKSQMRLTRLWWESNQSRQCSESVGARRSPTTRFNPYHDDSLSTEEMDIENMKLIWEDKICPKLVKASMNIHDIVSRFRTET